MSDKRVNDPNYNTIKLALTRSAKKNKDVDRTLAFSIDADKVEQLLNTDTIKVVRVNLNSKPVTPMDIPFLSEYFTKQKLEWFDSDKEYTPVIFVKTDDIYIPEDRGDEEITLDRLDWLLEQLSKEDKLPSDDDTEYLSEVVANYCCYFGCIVSYLSSDPVANNRFSYATIIRANKVTIASSRYKYNPVDMA